MEDANTSAVILKLIKLYAAVNPDGHLTGTVTHVLVNLVKYSLVKKNEQIMSYMVLLLEKFDELFKFTNEILRITIKYSLYVFDRH